MEPHSLVLTGAAVLLAVFLVKSAYLAGLSFVLARYTLSRQVGVAQRLFRAYMRAPYVKHLHRNSADLINGINFQALEVVGSVLQPVLVLTLEFLTVGSILLLLLWAEPLVSAIAALVLGGSTLVFLRVIRKRVIRHGHEIQHFRGRMIQAVNEGVGGIKIAKVLGREDYFLRRFEVPAQGYAGAARFRQVALELPRLLLEISAMVGLVGIAVVLLAQQRPIPSIIPTLSLLAVAVVRLIPSLNKITSSLTSLRYGRFALDAVYADLRTFENGDSVATEAGGMTAPAWKRLLLDDVHFTYPGAGSPSLSGISMEIGRGSVVGIVGPTGAGKTTLVDLILGLLQPTSGALRLEGDADGDGARVGDWQRRIGYVPQDVFLTDDSIRRNIAFGLEDDAIDAGAVDRAVAAAQLTTLVERLSDGLDTVVGERGIRLSGGQRQRIGIARALYHDPEVLILDEATSALDTETEEYVMQAVERLRGGRTIIIIAHRVSTVRACDQLFLLANGTLVGAGSYDEMLDDRERFRMLVNVD
jgi:ATP-binding cassette subfamily C protein